MAGFSTVQDILTERAAGKQEIHNFSKTIGGATTDLAGGSGSSFQLGGTPVAGSYSGTLTATQMNSSTTGAMRLGGAVSPDQRHIKEVMCMHGSTNSAASNQGMPCYVLLCDFLMYYAGINLKVDTLQTMTNSVTLPRYTNGDGVMMFMETTQANATSTATLAYTYKNSAGTPATKTNPVTVALPIAGTNKIGHITHGGIVANAYQPFLPLAAGDLGVTSLIDVTITSPLATTGTAAIVLCKPIAWIPITTTYQAVSRDFLSGIMGMPRVLDDACLGFVYTNYTVGAATSSYLGINIETVWG